MNTHLWFTIVGFNTMVAFLPLSAVLLYKNSRLWPYLLSLFSGIFIAFIDLGTDEVQLPALLLLSFTFFIGFAVPKAAWRWGIMTGVWIPVVQLLKLVLGDRPELLLPEGVGSILALLIALVGAYAGSWVRFLSVRRTNAEGQFEALP